MSTLEQRIAELERENASLKQALAHYYKTAGDSAPEKPQQSEDYYRLLAENATDIILKVSREDIILYVSPACRTILGYEPEEMIGSPGIDYFHPDDREWVANSRDTLYEITGQEVASFRYRKKTGQYVWLEANVKIVADPHSGQPPYLLSVLRDITRRKQLEEDLRRSEERYRSIFENAPFGIFHSTLDGKLIDLNPEFARMLGYLSPEECIETINRTSIGQAIYPDPARREETIRNALNGRGAWVTAQCQYFCIDRSIRWGNFTYRLCKDTSGNQDILEGFVEDITEKLRVETQLRRSEERFRCLADSGIIGIIRANPEGQILEVNNAFLEMLGYSREDFEMGLLTRQKITPPGYFEVDRQARQNLIEKGFSNPYEKEYIRKDGGLVPVLLGGAILKAVPDEGISWLVFVLDLTAKKQIEKEKELLLESEQAARKEAELERSRLHTMFMLAPAQIDIMRGPEHIFELIHPISTRYLEGRDILGLPVRQAIPELAGQGMYELLDRVYATGVPFSGNEVQVNHILKDGTMQEMFYNISMQPWWDLDGNVAGVTTFTVDITEQVRARQKVEESENYFRTLAESIPQIVWTALPDGKVDYYNRYFYDYTGLNSLPDDKEIWHDLVHPDDVENAYHKWMRAFHNDDKIEYETRIRGVDGNYRWFLVRGLKLSNAEGKVLKWLGTITDIHEQIQVQDNLKELDNLKDQFLSIASHDLRSPLTAVRGYAQLLQRQQWHMVNSKTDRDFDQYRAKSIRATDAILRQTERMEDLINRLLDFTRIQAGRLELNFTEGANLSRLVQQVAEDHLVTAEYHNIAWEVIGSETGVAFDEPRLEQVLNNLIGNAIKYSPANTAVVIRVEEDPEAAEVVVSVKDGGCGIKPEQQQHLFSRFYRVPNPELENVQGMGLGLYISHEIIRQHGGRMWVESEPGKGSSFFFSLPLKKASKDIVSK